MTGVVLQRFVDLLRSGLDEDKNKDVNENGGSKAADESSRLIHPNWQMMPIMKLGNKFNQYLTTSGKNF